MPELPEVEIVRCGLEPVLVGQRFVAVERRRKDLRFPFPPRFTERLEGASVSRIARRAKYLLAHLSSGDVLVMHLGMTGRFSIALVGSDPLPWSAEKNRTTNGKGSVPVILGDYAYEPGGHAKHDHVLFRMSGGADVTYNDPRRFGFMLLIPESELEAHPLFAGLGVEPLGKDLSAVYLAERAHGRRADLKAFLMDQRVIAGLGNIYVSEALHRAGLSPKRAAGTLAKRNGAPHERAERLVPEIRNVLNAALKAGGSTLKDYRHADGTAGAFQESFAAYDREGEPCTKRGCAGTIRRCTQAGRSTFYCPSCQR